MPQSQLPGSSLSVAETGAQNVGAVTGIPEPAPGAEATAVPG